LGHLHRVVGVVVERLMREREFTFFNMMEIFLELRSAKKER